MTTAATRAGERDDEPIRVLLVSHSSRLYGAERSLLLLATNLDRRRFEPLVVLPADGPLRRQLEEEGVEVALVRCPWWVRATGRSGRAGAWAALPAVIFRELSAQFRLCRLIRRQKIDLVYTNTSVIIGGALAARFCGRPHIWFVREILATNPDLRSVLPLGLLHRLFLRLSRTVLTNSAATAVPLKQHDRQGRLLVVHNAVTPLPERTPKDDPAAVEGLQPEDWVTVQVGTIQPGKAPEDAIRAAALARKQIPHLKLLFIGEGQADYLQSLHRLVEELGLSDTVAFAGFRPDARQLATACRALLMTSPVEPFGRVVAEAMLDGVPVVAVEGGGMGELVDDGVDGLLCPPNDSGALADRLRFLHDNPGTAQALAGAAREKAVEAFAPARHVEKIAAAMAAALEE